MRQDTVMSFINQTLVTFPLQYLGADWKNFPESDSDWANLMVYHLADTLNHCFAPRGLSAEIYNRLQMRSKTWLNRRPVWFSPIRYQASNTPGEFGVYKYISDVACTWFLSRLSTTNSETHDVSCGQPVLQSISDPPHALPPWPSATRHGRTKSWTRIRCMSLCVRSLQHTLISCRIQYTFKRTVRRLCGVGLSNVSCACAVGLACVGITLCRGYFDDDAEQQAFDNILNFAREEHGWPVQNPCDPLAFVN